MFHGVIRKTIIPLLKLQKKIVACRKCPRLVRYLSQINSKHPRYWCRPVPGFGDPNARIMLLGLAPGRFGSNRTGRMFTGDSSGKFLYKALYELGLANIPAATDIRDNLKLNDVYITAVVRCAPPQNKPTPLEIGTCSQYAKKEMELLPHLRVVVALGRIAHDTFLRLNGRPLSKFPFRHGTVYPWGDLPALVDVYHPSRQNTQTGLLTMDMFLEVLEAAKNLARNL